MDNFPKLISVGDYWVLHEMPLMYHANIMVQWEKDQEPQEVPYACNATDPAPFNQAIWKAIQEGETEGKLVPTPGPTKEALQSHLRNNYRQQLAKSLKLEDGTKVSMSNNFKTALLNAITEISLGITEGPVQLETESGFKSFTQEEMTTIVQKINARVQHLNNTFMGMSDAIESGSLLTGSEVDAIDWS